MQSQSATGSDERTLKSRDKRLHRLQTLEFIAFDREGDRPATHSRRLRRDDAEPQIGTREQNQKSLRQTNGVDDAEDSDENEQSTHAAIRKKGSVYLSVLIASASIIIQSIQ